MPFTVVWAILALPVEPVVRQVGPPERPLLLLTTHRRDAIEPFRTRLERGAAALAPAAESSYLEDPARYWLDYREQRFHDYAAKPTKVLTRPLPGLRLVRGGDVIDWQGLRIEVLDTPGYSPGAVSYLYEQQGRRFAVTGDLILGDGQLLDLYSLQDAIPALKVRAYHGYAARATALIESLRRLKAVRPDVLLPGRGAPIENPAAAIDRLIARLQAVFEPYFQTDALRWYWGDDHLRSRARGVLGESLRPWLEMAPRLAKGDPAWYRILRTSRLIVSESKDAILIDCGYPEVIAEIQKMQRAGEIGRIEAIYVTHYHDDHTDAVQAAADAFQAPVFFDASLREIYEQPQAFQMPAMTKAAIRQGDAVQHGHQRDWREFRLTSFFFPGQTLYHGALLVEHRSGTRLLFAGDSFTPSGIDDYCLWNRNLLGDRQGYFSCLRQLRQLRAPFSIVNEHVDEPFAFSERDLDFLEARLRERRDAIARLTVFGEANYGVDERWASLFPFAQEATGGQPFTITLRIDNPSGNVRRYRTKLHGPAGWKLPGERSVRVGPYERGEIKFQATAGDRGLAILTADVSFDGTTLPHWTEAMINVR